MTPQEQILANYGKLRLRDANEAETRLKVIDRILRDVLGWTDDDISPEEHVSEDGKSTYADYVLRTANVALIVEAKKLGAAFDCAFDKRRVKLTQSFLAGEFGEAVRQARDYARKLSIDYAVATNGDAWIIFPAQRHDQVTFQDSSALVFGSLQELLRDDFGEFRDLLSRDAVISGNLETALLGRSHNQVGSRKLGHTYSGSLRAIRSNPLYPLIEDAISTSFSDLINELEGDLLERSYVTTPETIRFDSKIQLQVSRRSADLGLQPTRPMKPSEADSFRERLKSAANRQKPLAVLLLGTVGSGKTTFLSYTRKVKAAELFKPRADAPYPHWVYIDFLNYAPSVSATRFIYEHLFRYIQQDSYLGDFKRCIRKAYESDIASLKRGPLFLLAGNEDRLNEEITAHIRQDYDKKEPYVDRVLAYAVRNTPVFLVIDNVDQIEDENAQSRLFAESLAIARRLGLNLILCMRQSTFVKHRASPALDAFDFEAFQIDAPKIASVLSKRFALTKHLLEGHKGEFIAENGAKVKIDNLANVIDIVQGSVLGTEIGTSIEVMATEDVRLALRMTRQFLERGYSEPGRALSMYEGARRYILPKHEAFRAIMIGAHPSYAEEHSVLGNPFDSRLAITNAQLLRLFVLVALVNYASDRAFRHVDGPLIFDCTRKIGFGDSYTTKVLADLCYHRMVFTASHGDADVSSSFAPSRLGGYLVRTLLTYFVFLENAMFDTYIADLHVWEQLRTLSSTIEAERKPLRKVTLRINRVQAFYEYMAELYAPLVVESSKRGLPAEWCEDLFVVNRARFRAECDRVLHSATRKYSPATAAPAQTAEVGDDGDEV